MSSASIGREAFFWMNGRLATGLEEISKDPNDLDRGGFWAVSTTFEGEFLAAKFANVIAAPFPQAPKTWQKITNPWCSSLDAIAYKKYVEVIQAKIAEGWVYQVNACRVLSTTFDGDLRALFSQILIDNPAPYASYLEIPGLTIASASPELFLSRESSKVRTSPIKGTKHLSRASEEFGDKDCAENVMIVDLMRNDLGQICNHGTVSVTRLLSTEIHPGLAHLVSEITGELQADTTWRQVCEALLPPGSVSGAPKSSAQDVIFHNEPTQRGPYCGALGWVENDQALLSVAIRIFWSSDNKELHFGTGAGITWGSDPTSEWDETQLKAQRLLSIAGGDF
ncbi:MAG: chorismate-binding protein [Actinobacteria bacterium]|nr:chorismate-binding protein [Actinomycetota bacterium]